MGGEHLCAGAQAVVENILVAAAALQQRDGTKANRVSDQRQATAAAALQADCECVANRACVTIDAAPLVARTVAGAPALMPWGR